MSVSKRSAVIMFAAAGWFCGSTCFAQISPGDLADAHKSLEGMKNCLQCHSLGAGPSAEKCLACHKEIASGLDAKRGYHHRVVNLEREPCFACHSDHAGRDFDLVHWPDGMAAFAHAKTGHKLKGKHVEAGCRDCHKRELVAADFRKQFRRVNLDRTFLGISRECVGCHRDEHRSQLGEECSACHGSNGWAPATGFDHDKTAYPLTGRHKTLACESCHPETRDARSRTADKTYARYRGVDFSSCSSCHSDVHKGKLGRDCQTCHETGGWHMVVAEGFDHSRTRFALSGRHRNVTCDGCHRQGSKLSKLQFDSCNRCHQDVHRGQFDGKPYRQDCGLCHNEDGFTPALFSAKDHEKTRFPLEGAHLAQPCVACHIEVVGPDDRYRQFRMDDISCRSCHGDKPVRFD